MTKRDRKKTICSVSNTARRSRMKTIYARVQGNGSKVLFTIEKIFSYTLELHLMIKMYKTPKRSFPTVECCVLQSWTLLVTIGSWCDDDVNIANEVVNLPLVNSGNRRDRGHRRHGPGRGWRHSQASYWGVRRQAAGQDRFWWANECLNRIGRLRTK